MKIIKSKLKLNSPAVKKLIEATYGCSIRTYFGTPIVVNDVLDLSKISNQKYFKRRPVLGFRNHISNDKSRAKLPTGLKDL